MQSDIREYYEYAICKAILDDALCRATQKGLTKDTDKIEYTAYPYACRVKETLFEVRDYLKELNVVMKDLRNDISLKLKSEHQKLSKQEKNRLLEIKKNQ